MGKIFKTESPVTWEKFQSDMKRYFSVTPSAGAELWEDSYLIYSAGFKAGLDRVAELIQHTSSIPEAFPVPRQKRKKGKRQIP
jgi:hypothetical protein